jgi:hypothetical protein
MEIRFILNSAPVTIESIREAFGTPETRAEAWDGLVPSLLLAVPGPGSWGSKWVTVGDDGDTPCESPEGYTSTRFKRIEGKEILGDVVAMWRTAMSGYNYALVAWRDGSQSWEYSGADKGFQSQDWIPEPLKGSVTVTRATGTYGNFVADELPGGYYCPLAAYRAAKAAWEGPFIALTGGDTAAAARDWQTRRGVNSSPALAQLFIELHATAAAEKRRQRLLRKQQAA